MLRPELPLCAGKDHCADAIHQGERGRLLRGVTTVMLVCFLLLLLLLLQGKEVPPGIEDPTADPSQRL